MNVANESRLPVVELIVNLASPLPPLTTTSSPTLYPDPAAPPESIEMDCITPPDAV